MKILAVNTANTLLSLALVDAGKVLHAYESTETRDQGNLLLKHMQEALKIAGLGFPDLDLLAVVTGPGSFTGIRIGIAALRAVGMAAKKPVQGVSSFELFAAKKEGHANIIAVESWREELYFQANDSTGAITVPPLNVTPEDFRARLATVPGPYYLSGDAAVKIHALLPDAVIHTAPAGAADAARLAAEMFHENPSPLRPIPFYLREADVTVAKKA